MPQKTNVCGVISITFSFLGLLCIPCMGAGIFFGIPAFILGIIGMTRKNVLIGSAIAGTIISIFIILISIIFLVFFGSMGAAIEALTK